MSEEQHLLPIRDGIGDDLAGDDGFASACGSNNKNVRSAGSGTPWTRRRHHISASARWSVLPD
jgi:hypothetical protein